MGASALQDRIIAIHQPPFLPWLGIVESLAVCDVFVMDDDVQYEDGGFQNRNRVKTANGTIWLTVPVEKHQGQKIREVRISTSHNYEKMWKTIELNYSKCEYFTRHAQDVLNLIKPTSNYLVDMNVRQLRFIVEILQSNVDLVLASSLQLDSLEKNDRLARMCQITNSGVIYAGSGTRSYLKREVYDRHGIDLVWHGFEQRHPIYRQRYARLGFAPFMGFIDMLFNCGAEEMRESLTASGRNCIMHRFT